MSKVDIDALAQGIRNTAPVETEAPEAEGILGTAGSAALRTPLNVANSIVQMFGGTGSVDVADPGWDDKLAEYTAKINEEATARATDETLMGISGKDVAGLSQNLGFTGSSMAAGLGTGIAAGATGTPGVGIVAGMTATGKAAFNMASADVMRAYLQAVNEDMVATDGQPMTPEEEVELKSAFDATATKHGLWEALPETIGQAAQVGVVLKPLAKFLGKNIVTKMASKLTGVYVPEITTEAITQIGQNKASQGTIMEMGERLDWNLEGGVKAVAEVAPQTVLLTTLTAGSVALGNHTYKAMKDRAKSNLIQQAVTENRLDVIPEEEFTKIHDEVTNFATNRKRDKGLQQAAASVIQEKARREEAANPPVEEEPIDQELWDEVSAEEGPARPSVFQPQAGPIDPTRQSSMGNIARQALGRIYEEQVLPEMAQSLEDSQAGDVIPNAPEQRPVEQFRQLQEVVPDDQFIEPDSAVGEEIPQDLTAEQWEQRWQQAGQLSDLEIEALQAKRDKVAKNVLNKETGEPRKNAPKKAVANLKSLDAILAVHQGQEPAITSNPAEKAKAEPVKEEKVEIPAQRQAFIDQAPGKTTEYLNGPAERDGKQTQFEYIESLFGEGTKAKDRNATGPTGGRRLPNGKLITEGQFKYLQHLEGQRKQEAKDTLQVYELNDTERVSAEVDAQAIATGAATSTSGKNFTQSDNAKGGEHGWFQEQGHSHKEVTSALKKAANGEPLTEKQTEIVAQWKDALEQKKQQAADAFGGEVTADVDAEAEEWDRMMAGEPSEIETALGSVEEEAAPAHANDQELNAAYRKRMIEAPTVEALDKISEESQEDESLSHASARDLDDLYMELRDNLERPPAKAEATEPEAARPDGDGKRLNEGDSFTHDGINYKVDDLSSGQVVAEDLDSGALETWDSYKAFEQETGQQINFPDDLREELELTPQEAPKAKPKKPEQQTLLAGDRKHGEGLPEKQTTDAKDTPLFAEPEPEQDGLFGKPKATGAERIAEVKKQMTDIRARLHERIVKDNDAGSPGADLEAQQDPEYQKLMAELGELIAPEFDEIGQMMITMAWIKQGDSVIARAKADMEKEGRLKEGAKREKVEPKEEPKDKQVGANREGNPLFEDENGNRYFTEKGVKVEAPVGLVPGHGPIIDRPGSLYAKQKFDFLTVDEIDKFSGRTPADPAGPGTVTESSPAEAPAAPAYKKKADPREEAGVGDIVQLATNRLVRIEALRTDQPNGRSLVVFRTTHNRKNGEWVESERNSDQKMTFGEFIRYSGVDLKVDAEQKAPAAPVAPQADYGADNKLVSQDRAEELRAKLRNKLNNLNSGVDPEMMAMGTELAVYHIEAGARSFAKFAKQMVADLGEAARPYLKSWYMGARYFPGLDAKGMDDAATVETANVSDIVESRDDQPTEGADETRRSDDGPVVPDVGRDDLRPDEGGGSSAQPGSEQQGLDFLGTDPTGDVEESAGNGDSEEAGLRPAGNDVEGKRDTDPRGDASDRRDGTGRSGVVDAGSRVAFHIDDPLSIAGGGQVARFNKNKAAIEIYNTLTEEGRPATAEEKAVLAGYTGWGSFGQELFDGSWNHPKPKAGWEPRDQWLRDHLGEQNWKGAQNSIRNAHYTDPPTVMAMWNLVEQMGFGGGRVLEPAMGIGNFYGMMPRHLKDRSNLAGIELDPLSGGMAKLIYPEANISIKGYQDSKTPDSFYDLVIGNWPFDSLRPADRRYRKLNPVLHDYFFLKSLDQVRPGGLVVGVTSHGSMDKVDKSARRAMAQKAELVASFRLPSGAFQEYAGTKVVTDIIILRKREEPLSLVADNWIGSELVDTPAGEKVRLNNYYADNPDHVLGTVDYGHGTTSMRPGLIVHRPDDLAERLEQIKSMVPTDAYLPDQRGKQISYITNHTDDRQGALTQTDDGLFVVRGEHLAPANEVLKYEVKSQATTRKRKRELTDLIDMRKAYAELIQADREDRENGQRKELRKAYEGFVSRHGALRSSYGLKYLDRIKDPSWAPLAALEINKGTAKAPKWSPSKILRESTLRGKASIDNPSATEAFVLARNEAVSPTLQQIARIAGKDPDVIRDELISSGAAFETMDRDIIPSDIYLSGNVRVKLRQAEEAVESGATHMKRNVEALEKVIPPDIPYHKIETQLGATWVPSNVYADYIAHMLDLSPSLASQVKVEFIAGRWKVRMNPRHYNTTAGNTGYGTGYVNFKRLINHAISNQVIKVTIKDSNKEVDHAESKKATDEANERIAKIREDFQDWLWNDAGRRVDLEKEYNESRNAYANPTFDGSFLKFQGMALELGENPFNLRQHQVNAIWRGLVSRRSLNAHEVGTGKTFTMAGIAIESRRYGIARKPLLLAHNANSATVATEAQMMYPGAQILYIDNLSPQTIDVKLRQIANDDWDLIVMPHSLIDRLTLSEETLMAMAQEEIDLLEQEAREAAEDDGVAWDDAMLDDEEELKKLRSVTAKDLVKTRNTILTNIQKQAQRASKENAVSFEELGIDQLLVDEGHVFKKPPIVTKMKMKGLNTRTSSQSISMQFLSRYVRANNNGGNIHIFTGTPVTNTLTEVFHQMRYVMEEEMKQEGLDSWDGWFGSFAAEVQDVELNAAAEYESVVRLASFINVPELRRMFGQYMDVVFSDDMPEMVPRSTKSGKILTDEGLTEQEKIELANGRTEGASDRPYKKVIVDNADMTPAQLTTFQRLQEYARAFRQMTGKEKKAVMQRGGPESPIITEGLANKTSLDVRLMEGEALAGQEGKISDDPNSKASRAVKNLVEVYNSHDLATQAVFTDTGLGNRATRTTTSPDGTKSQRTFPVLSTVNDMVERLVKEGIPREQIAVVTGSTSKQKRKEIAEKMNKAEIRIVFGSSSTLGVGVNMQRNLRAMHHLDAPWMPGDLEQRNGRGHRQGNQWNTVMEYRYITDRLDGRRWQVLSIKARFIKEFLTASGDTRVIEGEAAADEQNDLLETFSNAAGDPRILLLEKAKKKVEKLQRRERSHTFAIADAKNRIKFLEDTIASFQAEVDRYDAMIPVIQDAMEIFTMNVQGQVYEDKAEGEKALKEYITGNVRHGDVGVPVGSAYGFPIRASFTYLAEEPTLEIEVEGQKIKAQKTSLASINANLRNIVKHRDSSNNVIEKDVKAIDRLKKIVEEPFAQADALKASENQVEQIQDDMQANPVPPPAWLRNGSPVDTEVVWNGKAFIVAGHRWTSDNWYVMAEDDKGGVSIPYDQAKDGQGMDLYEPRDFEAPEVVDNRQNDQQDDQQDAGTGIALKRGKNPKRFGFNDPASGGGFTETSKKATSTTTRGMAPKEVQAAVDTMLKWDGAAPTVVVPNIGSLPNYLQASIRKSKGKGHIKGLYDPKSKSVFLVAENLAEPGEVAKVFVHEMAGHFGLRSLLGDKIKPIMAQVAIIQRKQIKEIAEEYGLDLTKDGHKNLAAEEVLAMLAESGQKPALIRRVTELVKTWLVKRGITAWKYTEGDLVSLVARSRRLVQGKGPSGPAGGGDGSGPAFSRGQGPTVDMLIARDKIGHALASNPQEPIRDGIEIGEVEENSEATGAGVQGLHEDSDQIAARAIFQAPAYGNEAVAAGSIATRLLEQITAGNLTTPDAITEMAKALEDLAKQTPETYQAIQDLAAELRQQGHPIPKKISREWTGHFLEAIGMEYQAAGMDPDDSGPMFSRAMANPLSTEGRTQIAKGTEDAKTWASERFKYLRRKFQDSWLPVKDKQKQLQEQGWQMDEDNDAYLAEELHKGLAKNDLREFEENHVAPLLQEIEGKGLTQAEVEQYLYALHAPERNAAMSEINEGVKGLSGMTNDQAAGILAHFRSEGKADDLQAIADKVHAITQIQRDVAREFGLETDEVIDTWEQYENYIPLKGTDKEIEEIGRRVGKGFDTGGKLSMRALGRASQASEILAHLFAQTMDTMIRAEKAQVGQAFLKMVQENKDDAAWTLHQHTPSRRVLKNNPEYKQIQAEIQRLKKKAEKATDEDVKAGLDAKVVELAELLGDTPRGSVGTMADHLFQVADNVFRIRDREGKVWLVEIHSEQAPGIKEALAGLSPGGALPFVQFLAKVNRYLAAINTTLNPEFVISNFMRDIQTAGFNVGAENGKAMMKKVIKRTPGSLAGIFKVLRGKDAGEWGQWYDRFRKAGSEVGFYSLDSVERIQEKIQKDLKDLGRTDTLHKAKLQGRKIRDLVEHTNKAVEQGVRLSAFRAAIEAGMSEKKAASLAKNLTVNFNRKGEWGTVMNAMYLFYNAGIQGSVRMLQVMLKKNSRKTAAKMAGAVVLTSFLVAEMNRLVGGEDEDDDRWDKIEDYHKETNLIVMAPGGGIAGKWKLPYGYNIFHVVGNALSDAVHGRNWMEIAGNVFEGAAGSFNPLGSSGGSFTQFLAPTLTDPMVQLGENKNFFGAPIMPEQNSFGPDVPDSQRAFRSARGISKEVTEWLNENTGGSIVESGAIDVSPETVDHILDFFTGGAGRFVADSVEAFTLPVKVMQEEEIKLRRIPVVRRFALEPNEYGDQQRTRENIDTVKRARDGFKTLLEAGRKEEALQFKAEHPERKLYSFATGVERTLRNLRRRLKIIEANTHMTPKEKNQEIQKIEEKIRRVSTGFNARFNDLK